MSVDQHSDLDTLYRDIDAAHLRPLWTITDELLTPEPRPAAVPWLWPARTMRPLAERSIDLVPVERGGERRVLSLVNPGLGGRPYAAGTLWGAIQCLGPRESAPAHRHSPGALRFVLEGHGVWTTVDGDACDMSPGDLVLTPGWTWHDHTNGGDEPMYWFDGLDLPMVQALDAIFFEPYPGDRQPVTARNRPDLVYRWADTDAALTRLAAASDEPMVGLEYTNPASGGSVLPTLACSMHRLRPGRATPTRRRTGNVVYVVFRGTGSSVIDGKRFDWETGDMFVVPSWLPEEHEATTPADLFALSDSPVLRALGLYREEPR